MGVREYRQQRGNNTDRKHGDNKAHGVERKRERERERKQNVGVHLQPDVFIHLYEYTRRCHRHHRCLFVHSFMRHHHMRGGWESGNIDNREETTREGRRGNSVNEKESVPLCCLRMCNWLM